ncbi:hypothetical protein CR513_07523, partial [Mucuna pruriens]
MVELETSFGERSGVRTIPILYTIVDAPASYNVIIGRPALNRLGVVMFTKHLCMKFPVGKKVGNVWADSHVALQCYEDSLRVGGCPTSGTVNALELDMDPRGRYEHEGPHPAEDLKEIKLGVRPEQTTKIGTAMSLEEEDLLVTFLTVNCDVFAWLAEDMPGVDPNFICHRLSIARGRSQSLKRSENREKRNVRSPGKRHENYCRLDSCVKCSQAELTGVNRRVSIEMKASRPDRLHLGQVRFVSAVHALQPSSPIKSGPNY